MNIQVDFWQLVTLLIAFIGFAVGAGKLLLNQFDRRLDDRFSSIDSAAQEWRRIEREVMTLKADLPLHYVRREDFVRNQTVIEAKIDSIAVKIENLQLRGSGDRA